MNTSWSGSFPRKQPHREKMQKMKTLIPTKILLVYPGGRRDESMASTSSGAASSSPIPDHGEEMGAECR